MSVSIILEICLSFIWLEEDEENVIKNVCFVGFLLSINEKPWTAFKGQVMNTHGLYRVALSLTIPCAS